MLPYFFDVASNVVFVLFTMLPIFVFVLNSTLRSNQPRKIDAFFIALPRENRKPSPGKIQTFCLFDFSINCWIFAFLDNGRVYIGFPYPVGSILAEYEPEPTHLDPIHCPTPRFLVLISCTDPTSANFCSWPFSLTVAFLIFLPIPRDAPSKVSMFRFRERSRGPMRGQLCSNKFQNLVRRAVFCLESRTAFIFSKYKKLYGMFQVLCSWRHARRGLLGAGNLTFGLFQALCPVVVPAGAFWGLEIWLFQFFKPFVRLSRPQGPFRGWKFDFFNFSSPLSSCRARRGLLGGGNFDFFNCSTHYSPLFILICPYLPLFAFIHP